MKRFIVGALATISVILPAYEPAYGQAWRRVSSERFGTETPQEFIFSCNFISKKSSLLRKTEMKISSSLYLSEIMPTTSVDINDDDLTQHSAESLCLEIWTARIKNDTLDYFKAMRRDLVSQVAARSRLLKQISSAEKQALYAEEEKRIERIKEQIRDVDRVIAQLQLP